jgi:hypothetical protein
MDELLKAAQAAEVQCDQAAAVLAEYGDSDEYARDHAEQLADAACALRVAIAHVMGEV